MIGASKILTVSYGTFSCTLEGFDEPFSTMKAIAEYFRDLAADDRYFGAEPPTPDAEMLHRIAERQIQRRVEAKVGDNSVLLRAEGSVALAAPALEEPATPPAVESVAAKLQRIRAAAEQGRSPAMPAAEVVAPEPVATDYEDEPNFESHEALAPPPAAAPARAPIVDDAILAPQAAAPVVASPLVATPFAQPTAEISLVPPVEPTPAPVAARVDRSLEDTISNVMASMQATAATEPAEQPRARARVIKVRRVETETGAPQFEAAPATDEEAAETRAQLAALEQARVERAAARAARAEADAKAKADAEAAAKAEAEAKAKADAEAEAKAEADARDEADTKARAEAEAAAKAKAAAEANAKAAAVAPASTLSPEAEAQLQAELAEVERDIAATRATAVVPKTVDAKPKAAPIAEAETAPIEIPVAETKLETAEAAPVEAPQAEAPVEVIVQAAAPVEPAPESIAAEPAPEPRDPARRAFMDAGTKTDDADLTRLMQHADTEQAEPENRRRLSAIQHLKAAVVATEAEKEITSKSGDSPEPSVLDRYRDDLAQAVRPRRPIATSTAASTRPVVPAERPAPLVLVSEQRIDDRPSHENLMIRPRRVTNGNLAVDDQDDDDTDTDGEENIFADSHGFAKFAEAQGAMQMPDLLEAAAAYALGAEGRPHFSRPQIMRSAITAVGEEEISRETSLRAFGMLLRQGRIQKVKRGQFIVAETSRYLAEARKLSK